MKLVHVIFAMCLPIAPSLSTPLNAQSPNIGAQASVTYSIDKQESKKAKSAKKLLMDIVSLSMIFTIPHDGSINTTNSRTERSEQLEKKYIQLNSYLDSGWEQELKSKVFAIHPSSGFSAAEVWEQSEIILNLYKMQLNRKTMKR